MRDLIKAVDLRVEPDSMITLNKPVERLYSKIGSAVSHGLSLGLSGIKKAIVKPPSYAYKKLVQEPKENRLGIESQAVLETLKEAQIAQGSAESCLTQLKRECVLKRTEKIRQEKVEKK
jgi:exonuclease I